VRLYSIRRARPEKPRILLSSNEVSRTRIKQHRPSISSARQALIIFQTSALQRLNQSLHHRPSKRLLQILTMTNFKASALSLFLIISSASAAPAEPAAAGCYPAYSPGSAYTVGTSVSQLITTTTPLLWTSCAVGAGCPTGWTQTGGVATTATHNFACISKDWCSNAGFAPGSVYTDIAWTKEATACSVS